MLSSYYVSCTMLSALHISLVFIFATTGFLKRGPHSTEAWLTCSGHTTTTGGGRADHRHSDSRVVPLRLLNKYMIHRLSLLLKTLGVSSSHLYLEIHLMPNPVQFRSMDFFSATISVPITLTLR